MSSHGIFTAIDVESFCKLNVAKRMCVIWKGVSSHLDSWFSLWGLQQQTLSQRKGCLHQKGFEPWCDRLTDVRSATAPPCRSRAIWELWRLWPCSIGRVVQYIKQAFEWCGPTNAIRRVLQFFFVRLCLYFSKDEANAQYCGFGHRLRWFNIGRRMR